jgi:hypothetical protein
MRVERVVPILRGERRRASNSDVRLNEGLLEDLGESRNEVLRGGTFCGDKRVRFSMMGVLRMGMCVCGGGDLRQINFGDPQKWGSG